MAGFWLLPAAPGTIADEFLERVRDLHGIVRDWIGASAVAQNNDHIRANLPYVDLMFAFGFATLGDHTTANRLVADARAVMEGPIPRGGTPQDEQAVTAALVRNFLFKDFCYRIGRALAGEPHAGPLSAEVLYDHERLNEIGGRGPINSSAKLAVHIIDRFRERSRIVEPQERVDPYAEWTRHGDPLERELTALHAIRDPEALADAIRKLYDAGVHGKPLVAIQLGVLRKALPLADRAGEVFAGELLTRVSTVISNSPGATPTTPELPRRLGELLERALGLAAHFHRADLVKKLADDFTARVRSEPAETRLKLVNAGARPCLEVLKAFGLTHDIDLLLTALHSVVMGTASLTELRTEHAADRHTWSAALEALVSLAGGWFHLGRLDRANPIREAARTELLDSGVRLEPKDYTALARAYVWALGQGPDAGFTGLEELFHEMDPMRITNVWTTYQHYSRFHLELVEDTVFAASELCRRHPIATIVSG